ncbi:hypothetical protein [Helicobacter himalayensis]|uniref:hypothetical protein n=1 Tax=Helicobacter himalayensis TaxID=1591088 RepID=UPI0008370642|nr:hypothetical protein [Helicobacter himalayensis]
MQVWYFGWILRRRFQDVLLILKACHSESLGEESKILQKIHKPNQPKRVKYAREAELVRGFALVSDTINGIVSDFLSFLFIFQNPPNCDLLR